MDSNVGDKDRQVALNFCNKFLDGAWKCATLDQIVIHSLSGGMSNLLFRCALSDDVELLKDEPRQVLLRIYGSSMCNIQVQVEVFNQLASAGLGPKLYSAFDGGRFEEYLPSSPLSWSQMVDDSISRVVAKKLALIHRLDIQGLDKVPNWLTDNHRRMYETVRLAKEITLEFAEGALETTRSIAMQMMAIDFNDEINFMECLFKRSNVPLVFSHNDLHQNNIIFLHQTDRNLENRIVLIDFEYCGYNYLTFDLANHLSEWCFDYHGDEYPNFSFSIDRYPSDEKQRQFLTFYVQGLNNHQEFKKELFGSCLSDSGIIDLLFNELQTFMMASNLLWCIWAMRSALTSKIPFGYWEMAQCKWEVYKLCKHKFKSNSQRHNNVVKWRASRL